MKTIQKEELFQNLKSFLKGKGIELQQGSYTHRIEQGCGVLADSINVSQKALNRAKQEMDKSLEHVRQVIHEKTAPKAPPVQTSPPPAQEPPKAAPKKRTAPKAKKASGSRAKKP